ncbi:MAG: OmpA family protein [candidate division KSB1 bacterium]
MKFKFTFFLFPLLGAAAHAQLAQDSLMRAPAVLAPQAQVYADRGKDKDGDGLSDRFEKKIGTNPHLPDSDNDGLVDSDEILTLHTNPLQADTDNDQLTDGEEVRSYRTLPNDPDSDKDGLLDGEEVHSTQTNPLKADSDLDGLMDGEELMQYNTNPLQADTDGDGVIDGIEVNSYVSNPLVVDSDGDGVADGADNCPTEAAGRAATSAGCPEVRPQIFVEVDNVMVLTGVNFVAGQAEPTPESLPILEKVYATLATNPMVAFEIRGYADGAGDAQKNLLLSTRRAESVFNYLVTRGIAPARLLAVGYGEENPVASNDTLEGRAQNRRIELHRVR